MAHGVEDGDSPYHSGGSQPAPTGSASDTPEYRSGVRASMAVGVACRASGSRRRHGSLARHEKAGTAARGQHAQVQQAVVGFDHREGADAITLCELSNRGHFGADAQLPPIYHRRSRDDLIDQAAAACWRSMAAPASQRRRLSRYSFDRSQDFLFHPCAPSGCDAAKL
jgi:hypothetical protein